MLQPRGLAGFIHCPPNSEFRLVIGGYEEIQHTESLRLLMDLVRTPTEFYNHFLRFPASLVFALTYGHGLDGKDLAEVQSTFSAFIRDISPGAHLVDTFPILDRLPDFLSPWRAEAKQKHQRELAVSSFSSSTPTATLLFVRFMDDCLWMLKREWRKTSRWNALSPAYGINKRN